MGVGRDRLGGIEKEPAAGGDDVGGAKERYIDDPATVFGIFKGLPRQAPRVHVDDDARQDPRERAAKVADRVHATRDDTGIALTDIEATGPRGAHRKIVPKSGARNEDREDIGIALHLSAGRGWRLHEENGRKVTKRA